MTILQFWIICVILCLMFWGLLFRAAFGQEQVTLKDMLYPSPYAHMYWPQKCVEGVCILTGLGGIVAVWEKWADENIELGKMFEVRGICASACEMMYWRIIERGGIVNIRHDAQLIYHKPTPASAGFFNG